MCLVIFWKRRLNILVKWHDQIKQVLAVKPDTVNNGTVFCGVDYWENFKIIDSHISINCFQLSEKFLNIATKVPALSNVTLVGEN